MKSSDTAITVMYLLLGAFGLWAFSKINWERLLKTVAVIAVLVVIFMLLSGTFQHQYPGQ